jgi:predicted ribosome quality control (RQC) complex YloA/Tae2 family protein
MQIYDEFCPILLNQFKSREHTKFETFDLALDEFYSKIESQRSEQQHKAKENSALQKLNKIRNDQVGSWHACPNYYNSMIGKPTESFWIILVLILLIADTQ